MLKSYKDSYMIFMDLVSSLN